MTKKSKIGKAFRNTEPENFRNLTKNCQWR